MFELKLSGIQKFLQDFIQSSYYNAKPLENKYLLQQATDSFYRFEFKTSF